MSSLSCRNTGTRSRIWCKNCCSEHTRARTHTHTHTHTHTEHTHTQRGRANICRCAWYVRRMYVPMLPKLHGISENHAPSSDAKLHIKRTPHTHKYTHIYTSNIVTLRITQILRAHAQENRLQTSSLVTTRTSRAAIINKVICSSCRMSLVSCTTLQKPLHHNIPIQNLRSQYTIHSLCNSTTFCNWVKCAFFVKQTPPTFQTGSGHFQGVKGRLRPPRRGRETLQALLKVGGPQLGQIDKETQRYVVEGPALWGKAATGKCLYDVFHCVETALLE